LAAHVNYALEEGRASKMNPGIAEKLESAEIVFLPPTEETFRGYHDRVTMTRGHGGDGEKPGGNLA
jgi:hypothetical protein